MSDTNKDIQAHMVALDNFKKAFQTITVDFNDLVIESVKLYWLHGNISVINRTMDTLTHMKGADNRALASYYMKCVPATFDKKEGRFGKKNPATVEKMASTWAEYILAHNWYELSKTKDSKPYELDIPALLKLVDSRLQKGADAESGNQITEEKLNMLAEGMNTILNKHMESDVEADEGDDGLTAENASELTERLQAVS